MKSEYEGSPAEFTILNVSGDAVAREAVSSILRGEGYRVQEAACGEEALRMAQEAPPELMVVEVALPDIDGFELCRRLKLDPRTTFVSVLHRSATYTDGASYVRGLETGADGYLIEPVAPEILLATVWALLRTARAKATLRKTRDELEAVVAERTKALQAEVRERRQAQELAQRQATIAQALAQAATELGQRLDLEAVLQAIYSTVKDALDVPVITISLYNEERAQFEPAFAVGLPPGEFDKMAPVPLHMTVQAQESSKAPVITRDVQALEELPNASFYRELDVRTTVNINLMRKDELVGRLNIGTVGQPREFSEAEMTLLRGFADLAALALNNARLYEEVKRGREQLAALNLRLTQTEEEERKRLAQELHDSAGQLATALQMNLMMLRTGVADEEVRRQVEEAEGLSSELYEEIRRVSHSLRPPHLQVLGLNGALEALCQQFNETAALKVAYEGEALPDIEEIVRIALYRVAQEALSNAARHASGAAVWVTLGSHQNMIRLAVEDNGGGFDMAEVEKNGGMGLHSMRERMELLNGSLEITSQVGRGTRVVARCAVAPTAALEREHFGHRAR